MPELSPSQGVPYGYLYVWNFIPGNSAGYSLEGVRHRNDGLSLRVTTSDLASPYLRVGRRLMGAIRTRTPLSNHNDVAFEPPPNGAKTAAIDFLLPVLSRPKRETSPSRSLGLRAARGD